MSEKQDLSYQTGERGGQEVSEVNYFKREAHRAFSRVVLRGKGKKPLYFKGKGGKGGGRGKEGGRGG